MLQQSIESGVERERVDARWRGLTSGCVGEEKGGVRVGVRRRRRVWAVACRMSREGGPT
jgi:hypothetical protein